MKRVLGVDLASRAWRDIGLAVIEWVGAEWTSLRVDSFTSKGPLTASSVAHAVDRLARQSGSCALSLDGPQGWRDPARPPPGVGRACEYATRTQGKVGPFGTSFPSPQLDWMRLSIDTFSQLLAKPGARLANSELKGVATDAYWVMECFPTQTWRSLGIRELPGKARSTQATVDAWAAALWSRLGLPRPIPPLNHDQLQAVIACLPAVAALGGPLPSRFHGEPARELATPTPHRVEGYIWDVAADTTSSPRIDPSPSEEAEPTASPDSRDAPFLPDERSEIFDELVERGSRLFAELVEHANTKPIAEGIDYAFFVATLYGRPSFKNVAGRNFQNVTDVDWTLLLADRITSQSGRRRVTRNGESIEAGMDTFIWNQDANRPANAWRNPWMPVPYNEQEWRSVFPDDQRSVRTVTGVRKRKAPRRT